MARYKRQASWKKRRPKRYGDSFQGIGGASRPGGRLPGLPKEKPLGSTDEMFVPKGPEDDLPDPPGGDGEMDWGVETSRYRRKRKPRSYRGRKRRRRY